MEELKLSKYGRVLNRFEYPRVYEPIIDRDLMIYLIRRQQDWANELLKYRGRVSIIDVYKMLELPLCGIINSTDGWTYGECDSFIDFGLYDMCNRDFFKGNSDIIILDFNVD